MRIWGFLGVLTILISFYVGYLLRLKKSSLKKDNNKGLLDLYIVIYLTFMGLFSFWFGTYYGLLYLGGLFVIYIIFFFIGFLWEYLSKFKYIIFSKLKTIIGKLKNLSDFKNKIKKIFNYIIIYLTFIGFFAFWFGTYYGLLYLGGLFVIYIIFFFIGYFSDLLSKLSGKIKNKTENLLKDNVKHNEKLFNLFLLTLIILIVLLVIVFISKIFSKILNIDNLINLIRINILYSFDNDTLFFLFAPIIVLGVFFIGFYTFLLYLHNKKILIWAFITIITTIIWTFFLPFYGNRVVIIGITSIVISIVFIKFLQNKKINLNFGYSFKIASLFVVVFGIIVYLFTTQFKYLIVNNYYKIIDYNPFFNIFSNDDIGNTSQRSLIQNGAKTRDFEYPFLICDVSITSIKNLKGIYPILYYGKYKSNPVFPGYIPFNITYGSNDKVYIKAIYSDFFFKKDNEKNNKEDKKKIGKDNRVSSNFAEFKIDKLIFTNKLPYIDKNSYIFGSGILKYIEKQKQYNGTGTFLKYFNSSFVISGDKLPVSLCKSKFIFFDKNNKINFYILNTLIGSESNRIFNGISLKVKNEVYPNSIYNFSKWALENNKFSFQIGTGLVKLNYKLNYFQLKNLLDNSKTGTGFIEKMVKDYLGDISNYKISRLFISELSRSHYKSLDQFNKDLSKLKEKLSIFDIFKLYTLYVYLYPKINIGENLISRVDCKAITMEEYIDKYAYDFVSTDIKFKMGLFLIYLWVLIFLSVTDISIFKLYMKK